MSPIGQRHEDQEWVKSVETRLVSLTSAQKQTDDDLDKHEDRLDEMDALLEGDPLSKTDTGLKGDLKDLSVIVNELRAIIAPDHLGQSGIDNRLKAVEHELGLRRKSRLSRKAFVMAVGVAIASTTGFIISNWSAIKDMGSWIEKRLEPSQSKAVTKAARAAAPRKRVVRVRVVPAKAVPEEADDAATTDVPE